MIQRHRNPKRFQLSSSHRQGLFVVIGVLCLIACMGFVAFSVDLGQINLTKTRMENAADAAALAAAMEITHSVQNAPPGTTNITGYARTAAAAKAAEVALLNGFYIDGAASGGDVLFGKRYFDETSGKFLIDWNVPSTEPANVLKVTIRKDDPDTTQPDGQLPLFFAQLLGTNSSVIIADSTAYVEARDIVVVHDFSRSMNFDSQFSDETDTTLTDAQIVANLQKCWDDLGLVNMGSLIFTPLPLTVTNSNPDASVTFRYSEVDVTSNTAFKQVRLTFSNGNTQTFNTTGTSGTFAGSSSNNGRDITDVRLTINLLTEVPAPASVSQSGSPTVNFNFSGDRKSVSISAGSSWNRVQLNFTDGSTQSISDTDNSATYSGTGGYNNRTIDRVRVRYGSSYRSWVYSPDVTYTTEYSDEYFTFSDNNTNVKNAFGLNSVSYPYPSGSWDDYINYVRSNSKLQEKGYCETYGGLTLVNYILRNRSSHSQTPALATARHFPFHAIKSGHIQMCDFLEGLAFDDKIGMVSYDTYSRPESILNESGYPYVNISDEPLSGNYQAVANLMRYKQANHYYSATNTGAGVRDAITMLDTYKRDGARPNILLMTDGNANTWNGPTDLPSGWESWFDGYDGPGSTFSISQVGNSSAQTACRQLVYEAKRAIDKGYVIHTMAVGATADYQTMKAIAFLGKGEFIHVTGGTSTEDLEAQLNIAFHKIAGLVPPAKLLTEPAP